MDKIKSFISYQWKHGGVAVKIIAINILVYLLYFILDKLLGSTAFGLSLINTFDYLFIGDASIDGLTRKPWTVLTYNFVHSGIFHLAMNMFILFFSQRVVLGFRIPLNLCLAEVHC